ncbi:MAG: hypothetical protein J0H83_13585 [Candidatus Melainabacteria bacterium]|nr:hypothetical protein [Candidatus Melainabacteria bacterium]
MMLLLIAPMRRKNTVEDNAEIKANIVADGNSVRNLDPAMSPSGPIPANSEVRHPAIAKYFDGRVQFSTVIPTQQPIMPRHALNTIARAGQLVAKGCMPLNINPKVPRAGNIGPSSITSAAVAGAQSADQA